MNNLTVGKFIDDLSSELPAPGGGAVAALVASLGGALTSMVYSLTKGKKVYEELTIEDKENMEKAIKEIEVFTKEALEYGKKDEDAFNFLISTYKLPKETDSEKEERIVAIRKATENCMNVPLALAEKSIVVYENIKFAAEKGNKNLITDAMIAAIMINSAIEASIINVKINLASIKNQEIKDKVQKRIKEIEEQSNSLKLEILNYGYKNI
ncbi:MAG: cyclodeaminase/cyclohydrolase family protein [Sarcina sp.]